MLFVSAHDKQVYTRLHMGNSEQYRLMHLLYLLRLLQNQAENEMEDLEVEEDRDLVQTLHL